MRRRRHEPGGDRGRLLHDAYRWLQMLDQRDRLAVTPPSSARTAADRAYAAIRAAIGRLIAPDDLETLRSIVAGDVFGAAHESLTRLAGPTPPDDSRDPTERSAIAREAEVRLIPGHGWRVARSSTLDAAECSAEADCSRPSS